MLFYMLLAGGQAMIDNTIVTYTIVLYSAVERWGWVSASSPDVLHVQSATAAYA